MGSPLQSDGDDTDPSDGDPSPPTTRRQDCTVTRHGWEVADPFRWLEADDEAVAEWTRRQNEYADAHLDTPTRARLESRMENVAETAEYGPVESAGGRYFRTVRAAGDDHARLFVSDSLEDRGRVLVDPNEWDGSDDGETRSLRWTLPGPDGAFVACGVAGGDEMVDIRVRRVEDGETVAVLRDCGRVSRAFVGFDPTSPGMVAWDSEAKSDGTGPPALVFVAAGDATESEADAEVRRWHPTHDTDGESTAETLRTHDGDGWPLVAADADSGTLAVAVHDPSGTEWHVRGDDGQFRPAFDDHGETFLTISDERVFVLTDHDAPRKRLLACSLSEFRAGDCSLDDCGTILSESERVRQSVVVTQDHLVVHALDDATSRLDVFSRDGTHERELSVPECGTVSRLRAVGDSGRIVHREESFARPPTLVATDPDTGERVELGRVELDTQDGNFDSLENLVVEQRTVESTDGADVPLFLCYRSDTEDDGSESERSERPTILHGYGGFRSSRPPSFDRFRLPFLADGGVFAQVCARGGQEYGEPWHEAGMGAQKQHTFDDFLAAARQLCASGVTTPEKLAVTGRSNGGLSVGAVVTQAPEQFGAALCEVPLLDMLRYHEFGMGSAWTGEYGDPADATVFDTLADYSPYHNVASEPYPPTLFTTATDDTRVHPCHARKMAARLQADGEGGPFLLRTRGDAGHGAGSSTASVVAAQTDRWTFLYDSLGVSAADCSASAAADSPEFRS